MDTGTEETNPRQLAGGHCARCPARASARARAQRSVARTRADPQAVWIQRRHDRRQPASSISTLPRQPRLLRVTARNHDDLVGNPVPAVDVTQAAGAVDLLHRGCESDYPCADDRTAEDRPRRRLVTARVSPAHNGSKKQ